MFDIDDPKLPDWVGQEGARRRRLSLRQEDGLEEYEKTLEKLQIELVKLQAWMQKTGSRVLALFEGRDAAGKGGTIDAVREYMNPRTARNVALTKPTETERGQWYFQRYVSQFPTSGEFVTFDRSWYNRAGVEPVMGFCTPEQHAQFLKETPRFEKMIVNEGIHFFKFWLDIGRETQLKRFHDRRHSPLTQLEVLADGHRRHQQVGRLHRKARPDVRARRIPSHAPWIIVRGNDKRRARLAVIRRILLACPMRIATSMPSASRTGRSSAKGRASWKNWR